MTFFLSNLKFWPYYLIAVLLAIIGIYHLDAKARKAELVACKAQNQSLEMTLSQLQVLSDAQNKKATEAHKQAQKIYRDSQVKIKDVLGVTIPQDCEGAVKVGVNLGQKL